MECCYASGGRVVITAGSKQWAVRSSVTVNPLNYERSVESNQDGSIYVTTKPVPAKAEITLSDSCDMVIEDIMNCPIDVTIKLIDVRRKYMFTAAVVVGTPSIDTESGAISGLTITSNDVTSEKL